MGSGLFARVGRPPPRHADRQPAMSRVVPRTLLHRHIVGASRTEVMTASSDPIVIVSAVRTPLGRFLGDRSPLPAHALGAQVIRAALERAGVPAERPGEVLMGCVLPAGQGQAPARQAARGAGLADAIGATTVNKVCGSGMKAAMLGH